MFRKFSQKKWIFRTRKLLIFLKIDSFSNTLNLFKMLNFAPIGGLHAPDPLLGGSRDSFLWPGVPFSRTIILPMSLILLLMKIQLATTPCQERPITIFKLRFLFLRFVRYIFSQGRPQGEADIPRNRKNVVENGVIFN